MAITWGSAVSDATNAFRIGYEITQSPSSVTSSTATVTVTLKIYLGTKYYADDTGANWSISGSISDSGSTPFDHNSGTAWSGSNVTLLATRTRSYTLSYSTTQSFSFSASVNGLAVVAGTASVSGSSTVPKRPISAPATPGTPSVARVSDTQHTVTWTNTSPTSASNPYTNVEVYRSTNGGTYAKIATLGVVTSYSDKTTTSNSRYSYKVRATNSAGASGYSSASASIDTTPAAPSNVVATKGATDITVTWNDNSTYNATYEVWHAANGVWDASPIATPSDVPGSETWVHSAPNPSVTHTYKVRAKTSSGLLSAYSADSNVVQLLAAPLAPTNLSPTGISHDADEDLVISWQHNPVDTTAQTKRETRYRVNGGAWVEPGSFATTSQTRTWAAGTFTNGTVVEWQVRTWGQYVDPSPWSASASITMSARPTASIVSPDGVTAVGTSSLTVEWAYYDAESTPQAQWKATLLNGSGSVVETLTGVGVDTSATFTKRLVDGASYSVTVEVQDGSGLWSVVDTQSFAVSFALPPVPTQTLRFDRDTGSVSVTIDNPPTSGTEADAVSNQVFRSLDGESWSLVADDVPLGMTVVDFIPPLGVTVSYKTVVVSALPSTTESAVGTVATTGATGVFINGGPGFATLAHFAHNPTVDITVTRSRALLHFAGRRLPVEFRGEQADRSISLSAPVYTHAPADMPSATEDDVEALVGVAAPACYRDASGRRYFVSVGDPSFKNIGTSVRTVSWDFDEIDWTEPSD